jgi:hypothetical protein
MASTLLSIFIFQMNAIFNVLPQQLQAGESSTSKSTAKKRSFPVGEVSSRNKKGPNNTATASYGVNHGEHAAIEILDSQDTIGATTSRWRNKVISIETPPDVGGVGVSADNAICLD